MRYSGIYKIQSKIKPNRCYIGSAVIISKRWKGHLSELKLNTHPNSKLQNHYNKYGESDLIFTVLIGCEKQDLIKHEQYFIDAYNPWFNICSVAGSVLGRKCSEAAKLKTSNANKGNKYCLGYRHTEDARKRIGEAASKRHKGKKQTQESNNKRSESCKRSWIFRRIRGDNQKPRSEETKRKLSEATKRHYQKLRQTISCEPA